MKKHLFLVGALLVTLLVNVSAFAGTQIPECTAYGKPVDVDNDAALNMKFNTQNGYKSRAYVAGVVSRVFPDRNGHSHFEIQIGTGSKDTIEIVYNEDFGRLPQVYQSDVVEACGEYITSNARNGQYPASPSGAIIHWVHYSPHPDHDSGFVVLNKHVYGFDIK